MSFFSSARERRLWLWVLATLAAIYASMGPVGSLVAALRERNLLRLSIALALVVIGVAVIGPWLRRRPGWREIGVALAVAAVYLLAWVRIPIPEERTHLAEYGVVALLIHQALAERARQGRRVPAPAALAVAATALLGWLDEAIQATLPHRVYDLRDVGVNALAGLMAIAASLALTWARRLAARRRGG